MDRETLEALCQTFAARHPAGVPTGTGDRVDPVPEILRSFRLAEISAAEMESLLGLVSDAYAGEDGGPAYGHVLAGFDGGLDEPPVLVDDLTDLDRIVASGSVEDDDHPTGASGSRAVVEVRLSPAERGAEVGRMTPPRGT